MYLDDYESIRQHMTRYIETGSIATPSHGRGQRTSQKTSRYDDSDEESERERVNFKRLSLLKWEKTLPLYLKSNLQKMYIGCS